MKNDTIEIKTNTKQKKINNVNNLSLLHFYGNNLFLIIIFFSIFNIFNEESKISLIIREAKIQNFISDFSIIRPNDFNITCKKLFENPKQCNFENSINEVTIEFLININSLSNMFNSLTNLIEIDLSNFDFSNIKDMSSMFNNCENLEKINFGKKRISSVEKMECLFHNCKKLKSIDLSGFNTSSVTNMSSIFRHCESLISIDVSKFDTTKVVDMYDIFGYCYELTSIDVSNFKTSKVKVMQGMFVDCKKLKSIDLSNFDFSSVTNIGSLFGGCISLEFANLFSFRIKGDISSDGMFKTHSPNLTLCINDKNTKNHFRNQIKKYDCSDTCIKKNLKIDLRYNSCIKFCNESEYKYEFNNTCYSECPQFTNSSTKNKFLCIDQSKELIDNNIDKIIDYEIMEEDRYIIFLRGLINNSNIIEEIINNKNDFFHKINDTTYLISTSENQKNDTYYNISRLLLENCEDILRFRYDINKTFPLIIFKVDYKPQETLIPIIGYEIYHPLNKSKLDLKDCKDIKINIPVSINENELFKHEPNSDFYTNDCFSYTTENGTDIILQDRKQEFIDKNLSLCQNNCTYIEYNKNKKQSSCECLINNKMDYISEIISNPNKLSNNFDNDENSHNDIPTNIKIMKCTNILFSKEGIISNISSYVLLIIISHFLLSIILFIKCGYNLLENDIFEILSKKKKAENNNKNHKKKHKNSPPRKQNKKNTNIKLSKSKDKNSKVKGSFINNFNSNKRRKKKNNTTLEFINKSLKNKKITFNDFELNSFSYENAILYDKRSFCDYYLSLLKSKHPILFSFCPIKDYNTMIIKTCIFSLSLAIYYTINFSFFDNNDIHRIYKNGGKYDIVDFLPKIIIAFFISYFICVVIKYIFLSERNILEIKKQPSLSLANNIARKVKKNLVIKYIIFFILGIIFLMFFWMLLSSFGAVFQNSQIFVFKNTLISIGISLIYPFFINIFPCIFRILSLNSKSKYLFKFNKFLQII